MGTPQKADSLATDLTYIEGAVAALVPYLKPGSLIVGKSTVPVGTAKKLLDQLAITARKQIWHGTQVFARRFCYRRYFALIASLSVSQMIVPKKFFTLLHAPLLALGTPWIRADLPTAELVKVAANSFLATKISFINAMAEVCEAAGGDVTLLAQAIGYDPRVEINFCKLVLDLVEAAFPKIFALLWRAPKSWVQDKPLSSYAKSMQSTYVLANVLSASMRAELTPDLGAYKIAVLGAAFKPDSDDVRDSPSLDIATQLRAAGTSVTVHDPKAIVNARNAFLISPLLRA